MIIMLYLFSFVLVVMIGNIFVSSETTTCVCTLSVYTLNLQSM